MSQDEICLAVIEVRLKKALEQCRDNGNMGGFHSPDANRCVLCGWAQFHIAQFGNKPCGNNDPGEHLFLSDLLALLEECKRLQRIEVEAQKLKFSPYPAHGSGFVMIVSEGNVNELSAALSPTGLG